MVEVQDGEERLKKDVIVEVKKRKAMFLVAFRYAGMVGLPFTDTAMDVMDAYRPNRVSRGSRASSSKRAVKDEEQKGNKKRVVEVETWQTQPAPDPLPAEESPSRGWSAHTSTPSLSAMSWAC